MTRAKCLNPEVVQDPPSAHPRRNSKYLLPMGVRGEMSALVPAYEPPGKHRRDRKTKALMMTTATKTAPVPAPTKDLLRRDELILNHLSLVTAIATRVHETLPVHVELDDLIHAGVMGLFDAATKYDTEKQVAFPAYAKHRIKGAILDSLRDQDWASRDLRRRQKQVEQITRDLTAKLNREPAQHEIAAEMGVSPRQWTQMMVDFGTMGIAATQARKQEREDQPAPEVPCTADNHPDRVFARSELRGRLAEVLKTLPLRYQQVVTLYYDRDMTMKEIGNTLGVNESRISQIHKSALARMHMALESAGIQSAAALF